jgi:hypothetical protein
VLSFQAPSCFLRNYAKHLRLWNCEHFGNQESRLLTLTNKIAELENKQAESILIVDKSSISMLNSDAVGCYSGLFAQPLSNRETMGPLGFKHLTEENSTLLERAVTMEELEASLWDCDDSKSPGSDCFNLKLYRKAWGLICHDLFSLVNDFFTTITFPKGLKSCFCHFAAED